jgi:uncharacterized damage-inducible protein DinB
MDLLDRLLDHDRWATATLLDLSRAQSDDQLDHGFDIGHRTIRATFDHMIYNISFWTGLMSGNPVESNRDDQSVAALIQRHERAEDTFATFARQMRDEQRLNDTFVDHYGSNMTFGGAIVHVILHNAEHRTEVLHILQRLGVPDLPEVDHGLWDHVSRGTLA